MVMTVANFGAKKDQDREDLNCSLVFSIYSSWLENLKEDVLFDDLDGRSQVVLVKTTKRKRIDGDYGLKLAAQEEENSCI